MRRITKLASWRPRKALPALFAFSALLAFLVTTVPAQAAPARPAIPQRHIGQTCVTVHSSKHNRTGVMCIMVNTDDAVADQLWQAELTFQARSGKLTRVTVNHLNFKFDGVIRESANFVNKHTSGTSSFIATAWFLGTHQVGWAQGAYFGGCMYWTDGGHACVNSWHYSHPVYI